MEQCTREQLYRHVWEQPMQKLAQSFNMSDVGLAKICRKVNVPLPPRGYWAKLQAGKPVDPPPALPPRAFGLSNCIDIGSPPTFNRHAEDRVTPEPPQPPHFEESLEAVASRARDLVGEVRVPKNLATPHPTIARYLRRDDERRLKQQQSPYPLMWDAALFDSPLERRRLRILSALFTTLERCGVCGGARGREARELSALVGSTQVYFSLEPMRTKSGAPRTRESVPPLDSLRFELQWWTSKKPPLIWEDEEAQPLEERVAEIATQMLVTGEAMFRDWQQQRYNDELKRRAELAAKARLRREAEERADRERIAGEKRQRIDSLLAEITAWRRAEDIRAYVRARLSGQSHAATQARDDALEEWARWALRTAKDMDPLCDDSSPG